MLWWVTGWWELGDYDGTSLFSLTVSCLQLISPCQRIWTFPFETALHEGAAWQGGIKGLCAVHSTCLRLQLLLPSTVALFQLLLQRISLCEGNCLSPYLYSCKLKDLSTPQSYSFLGLADLLCSRIHSNSAMLQVVSFFTIMEKMQEVGRRRVSWSASRSSPFLLLKWKTPSVSIILTLGRGRK